MLLSTFEFKNGKTKFVLLPYFNTMAIKLIEERGAVEVMLVALVYISGVTTDHEIKSRSLLSSQTQVILYTLSMFGMRNFTEF